MPGVPVVYYGDEIGLRHQDLPSKEGGYNRTGARCPMQWDGSRNAGFSSAPASDLYLPIDARRDRPTVAAQERDPDSLLHHVRRLAMLRRQHPVLGNTAGFTPLFAQRGRYPFVYERRLGRQRAVIAVNPSARSESARIHLPGAATACALASTRATFTPTRGGAEIVLGSRGWGIWLL